MGYKFKALSDAQLDELTEIRVVEEGKYKFIVLKSKRTFSKSGNDMCELQLKISKDDVKSIVFDYLVFTDIPLNIRKVKHFCDSTGLIEQYKNEDLQEDLTSLEGYVDIGIKEETTDDYGRVYKRRNIVNDYIKQEIPKEVADVFFNDDVKF